MTAQAVHYELHVRRRPSDDWALDHASPSRTAVLTAAGEMLSERRVCAVRVCKEIFRQEDGFTSVVIFEQDLVRAKPKPARRRTAAAPPCTTPADLLTGHARVRIAELFAPVLVRERVTAWELLHRPDLAQRLEASGLEIQNAVVRVAVPEAQAQEVDTHDMVRAFQRLADATLERLIRDGRRGCFPPLEPQGFAAVAERLCEDEDGAWRLGGAVAASLREAGGWRGKAERLSQLLAEAPREAASRALAMKVLEPPLTELLGGAAPLSDLIGAELDLGGQLAVLVRIAAAREAELLSSMDAGVGRVLPPLEGPAAHLAALLDDPALATARAALAARIVGELTGQRRLRPGDPDGELDLLRALAAVLTAAGGRLLPKETVRAAFLERSKRLVTADFVGDLIGDRGDTLSEARALLRLCGHLTGPLNKRAGALWLLSVLGSLRFEKEMRTGPDTASARLAALASLQRAVEAAGLPEAETGTACKRLGEAGGWVEEGGGVVAALAGSAAPPLSRLAALMKLASGEGAPAGPAARRAAEAARRLAAAPELRSELAVKPYAAALVRAAAAA